MRDVAWSPDGKRIAVVWYDAIWTMTPDGRDAKKLVAKPQGWTTERDPAWSPTGSQIVFAAEDHGEFRLWTTYVDDPRSLRRMGTESGDDRWPSWTDGNLLVFSHRAPKGSWHLYSTLNVPGSVQGSRVIVEDASEWQGVVSPDGKAIAFVSDRDLTATGASEIWVRQFGRDPNDNKAIRVTTTGGTKLHPTWSPDGKRIAYYANRSALGTGVFVSDVPNPEALADAANAARGARGGPGGGRGARGGGAPGGFGFAGPGASAAPTDAAVLASRHAGLPAWSHDGEWLAIATFPPSQSQYNGDPDRNDDDAPMVLANADAYQLWRVLAPRAVDQGAAQPSLPAPDSARWLAGFDQVWRTVKSLYYDDNLNPSSAKTWDALREKYRPQAMRATDLKSFDDVVDAMIAEEPPFKPGAESTHGVATSGSPLASAAGTEILEKGGNVVDAGIAVAIALGVVEPDATSLGGDGQAILFLKGMTEPVVVEYKDMSPSHATPDNTKLFTVTGGRTASDGPTVANIPGVAAGLDLLYQKYGSHKVAWADLVAPAIKLADEGFILDEALPTTIAEGHAQFAKYSESAKLFLPGGRIQKPGDRFVNKDYAETLRILAKEGGRSFYEGTLAKRIVADMEANGGVITAEDLAQYRAMERKPLVGRYRNHLVYSVPAPVSSGAQLIETLQILDNYQPKPGATYTTDADYLHYVIDAWRVRDGGGRIADPERWPVDYGNHLEPGHAQDRFKLLDPMKAYSPGGGRGGLLEPPISLEQRVSPMEQPVFRPADPLSALSISEDETRRVQTGTTAFVVADAQGNMIAFTQTLSTWGGNYYVSKGLGFLYNDHFRGGFGRGGGGFGSLLPLMRSNSTSVPTLVFAPSTTDSGAYGIPGYTPLMAVGCAGNAWIPASVYEIILNVIDGGMSAQRAIEAPRFLVGGGATVQIEDRFPRALLDDLEARGHSFQKVGRKGEVKYGYASVAVIRAAKGTVEAGAEPRRSHGAVGASK